MKLKNKEKGPLFAVASVQEVSFPQVSTHYRWYSKIVNLDLGYCSLWNSWDAKELEIECRDREDKILEGPISFFKSQGEIIDNLEMVKVGNNSIIAGSSYRKNDNNRGTVLKLISLSNSGLSIEGSYEGVFLRSISYQEEFRFLQRNASKICLSVNYMLGPYTNGKIALEDIEIDFSIPQATLVKKGITFEKDELNSYSLNRQSYFKNKGLIVLGEISKENIEEKDCFLRLIKHNIKANSYEQITKIRANLRNISDENHISIDNDEDSSILVATYRGSSLHGEKAGILARAFIVSDEGFETVGEEIEISQDDGEDKYQPIIKYIKELDVYLMGYTKGTSDNDVNSVGDFVGRIFKLENEEIRPISEYFLIQSEGRYLIGEQFSYYLDWDYKTNVLRMSYETYPNVGEYTTRTVNIKIDVTEEGEYPLKVDVGEKKLLYAKDGNHASTSFYNFDVLKVRNKTFCAAWRHYDYSNHDIYSLGRCFKGNSMIAERVFVDPDNTGNMSTKMLKLDDNLFVTYIVYKTDRSFGPYDAIIKIQSLNDVGWKDEASLNIDLESNYRRIIDSKKIGDNKFMVIIYNYSNDKFEIREYSYKKESIGYSISEDKIFVPEEDYGSILSYESIDDLNIVSDFRTVDGKGVLRTKVFKRTSPGQYIEVQEFNPTGQSSGYSFDLSSCSFDDKVVFFYTNKDESDNLRVYSTVYKEGINSLETLIEGIEIADNLPGNKGMDGVHKNNRVEHLKVNGQDYLLYSFQYNTELAVVVYKYERASLKKVSQTIRIDDNERSEYGHVQASYPRLLVMDSEGSLAKVKVLFSDRGKYEHPATPVYLGSVDLEIDFSEDEAVVTTPNPSVEQEGDFIITVDRLEDSEVIDESSRYIANAAGVSTLDGESCHTWRKRASDFDLECKAFNGTTLSKRDIALENGFVLNPERGNNVFEKIHDNLYYNLFFSQISSSSSNYRMLIFLYDKSGKVLYRFIDDENTYGVPLGNVEYDFINNRLIVMGSHLIEEFFISESNGVYNITKGNMINVNNDTDGRHYNGKGLQLFPENNMIIFGYNKYIDSSPTSLYIDVYKGDELSLSSYKKTAEFLLKAGDEEYKGSLTTEKLSINEENYLLCLYSSINLVSGASENTDIYAKLFKVEDIGLIELDKEIRINDDDFGIQGPRANGGRDKMRVKYFDEIDTIVFSYPANGEFFIRLFKIVDNKLTPITNSIKVDNIELNGNSREAGEDLIFLQDPEDNNKGIIRIFYEKRLSDKYQIKYRDVHLNIEENTVTTTVIPETTTSSNEEYSSSSEINSSITAGFAVGTFVAGGIIGYCASKIKNWLIGRKRAVLPAAVQQPTEDPSLPSMYANPVYVGRGPVYTSPENNEDDARQYASLDPDHQVYGSSES